MEEAATPSLRTLIAGAMDRRLAGVRVSMPGRVLAYDAARGAVDVQALISDGVVDDGERTAEALPVLVDVPLMFPGAGPYRITWPIEAGAIVLLVVASSSIARWKVGDGVDVTDPGSDHRHHIEDAIAIPGLHAFGAPPTEAPTDALVIHGPAIRLGAAAADPIMRRSDMVAALAAVDDRISTHIHGVAAAPGPTGMASASTAPPLPIDVPPGSPTVTSE